MAQPVPQIKKFNPTVSVRLSIKQYYNFRIKAIEANVNFTAECTGRRYAVLMEENFALYCGFSDNITQIN